MMVGAPLDRWIADLRDRLRRGELDSLDPIDIGDGTGDMPAEQTIRIMLADLDDIGAQLARHSQWSDLIGRRRGLLDDFRRLRDLIDS